MTGKKRRNLFVIFDDPKAPNPTPPPVFSVTAAYL